MGRAEQLLGLPITYYITTPLTPKAELEVTSALNGMWFFVSNVDKRLTVQDVWITFSFEGDRLNHILQDSSPDDLCTKITKDDTRTDRVIFKCDFINPGERRRFSFLYENNTIWENIKEIDVNATYQGYSTSREFYRCHNAHLGNHLVSGFAEKGKPCK